MTYPPRPPREPIQVNRLGRVIIPKQVFLQLEQVRIAGEINMIHRSGIQFIADRRGFHALVVWLEEHKDAYVEGLHYGFVPDEPLTVEEKDTLNEAETKGSN